MSSEILVHIVEIILIGTPMWFGVLKLFVVFREYPPHLHESDGNIRYPKGMEPGKIQKVEQRG